MLPLEIYIWFSLKYVNVFLYLCYKFPDGRICQKRGSFSFCKCHSRDSRYIEVNLCSYKNKLFKMKLVVKFLSHKVKEVTLDQWFSTMAAYSNCLGSLKNVLMIRLHPDQINQTHGIGCRHQNFFKFPRQSWNAAKFTTTALDQPLNLHENHLGFVKPQNPGFSSRYSDPAGLG